jgi:thioredoxin 1
MNGPIDIHMESFSQTVKKDGIVLVDWWASWCGPCRAFAPVFARAAKKHPDLTFAKVDVDAEQALASAFRVRSIPTLMIFRDGVLVFSQPGALPAAALDALIAEVRALDMTEVRRKIAEHAKGQLGVRA